MSGRSAVNPEAHSARLSARQRSIISAGYYYVVDQAPFAPFSGVPSMNWEMIMCRLSDERGGKARTSVVSFGESRKIMCNKTVPGATYVVRKAIHSNHKWTCEKGANMGRKANDETVSNKEREDDSVTRDGSLDRTRDFKPASNDDRQQHMRDGSLDRRREITVKKLVNKPISNTRDGSLDRTRTAPPAKVESKALDRVRSGSLDDTRGAPGNTLAGSLDGVKGAPETFRDGSLDSTRAAEPKKTNKKIRRVA